MTAGRKRLLGKFLEAVGIAATMIGLVQGIYGDMWGELYLFLGGIFVFLLGRQIEKHAAGKEPPAEVEQHSQT